MSRNCGADTAGRAVVTSVKDPIASVEDSGTASVLENENSVERDSDDAGASGTVVVVSGKSVDVSGM